jgi:hypothetical protein
LGWNKNRALRIYRFFAISIIPQWLLLQWIKCNPEIVDQFYSQGVFIWLSKLSLLATAWIHFSVGDLFYAITIAFILKRIWHFKHLLRWSTLTKILGGFGFLFFLFHLQWGLHYHQTSLSSRVKAPSGYSSKKLESFTHHLIEQTNQFQKKLSHNDSVAVEVPYTTDKIFDVAVETIRNQHRYPISNIKKTIFSLPLSYMGYGGYINPFTLEAQVNEYQPKLRLLTTSAHEIAHQLGYAAEEEANFIAIDAALHSDDLYMQYAGYHLALGYALADCRKRKDIDSKKLYQKLNVGVLRQYQQVSAFWQSYQNPLEPFFKKSYDTYLKANNQTAGINSYSLVVGLLLHKYQKD